jgi:NADPH:quinone reductase-like Zn-dependent oxidoreductase
MTRALVYDRYGSLDVLTTRDVSLPAPEAGERLVRVRAAALNPKDSLVRKGRFSFLSGRRFPKLVGVDYAGELDTGARVWGALEEVTYARGTLADEVVAREGEWGPMPATLGFEEAASLPLVGLTALQALRDLGSVKPGARVAIHGASGGVGTAAIQLARSLGAHVTTTSSEGSLALCRSLGADVALDRAKETLDGGGFDLVFDVFGNLRFSPGALSPRGVFVSTVPSAHLFADIARTAFGPRRAKLVLVRARRRDLDELARLVDSGALRPVIDRIEPFSRAKEAIAHLETKRTRGKIVVRMSA